MVCLWEFPLQIYCFLIVLNIEITYAGKSILSMTFDEYTNEQNSLFNGECCVKETSICRIGCGAKFEICLSNISSPSSCSISKGKTVTQFYIYGRRIHFRNYKLKPFLFYLADPEEPIFIEIIVYAEDARNRTVAKFTDKKFTKVPSQTNISTSVLFESKYRRFAAKTLVVNFTLHCTDFYEPPNCKHKCIERDDVNGHYQCHKTKGKICMPGWMDVKSNCTKRNKSYPLKLPVMSSIQPSQTSLSSTIYNRFPTPVSSGTREINTRIKPLNSSSLKIKHTLRKSITQSKRTIEMIGGKGILSMSFDEYINKENTLMNGECCVEGTSACRLACGAIFEICLSNVTSPTSCSISKGKKITSFYNYGQRIHFRDDPSLNPFQFHLNELSKPIFLEIIAFHDKSRQKQVARFTDPNFIKIPIQTNLSTSVLFESKFRRLPSKILIVNFTLHCTDFYEPPDCKHKCIAHDDITGHYKCHETNGKICMPGWMDAESNCTKRNESYFLNSVSEIQTSLIKSSLLSSEINPSISPENGVSGKRKEERFIWLLIIIIAGTLGLFFSLLVVILLLVKKQKYIKKEKKKINSLQDDVVVEDFVSCKNFNIEKALTVKKLDSGIHETMQNLPNTCL